MRRKVYLPHGTFRRIKEKYPEKYGAVSEEALRMRMQRGDSDILSDLKVAKLEIEQEKAEQKSLKAKEIRERIDELYKTNTLINVQEEKTKQAEGNANRDTSSDAITKKPKAQGV